MGRRFRSAVEERQRCNGIRVNEKASPVSFKVIHLELFPGIVLHSNLHFLVLVERRLIAAPIIELRSARGRVGGHDLRVLQRALALEVIGDAGRAHRMIADARLDACLARASLNHPVAVLLRHAVRPTRKTSGGAKQRPVLVVRDSRRRDIRIEVRFELRYTRRFMFLPAFFREGVSVRAVPG